jgi:hypothetical protein
MHMHVLGGAKKERNPWKHTCPQGARKNKKGKKKKEKPLETCYACPKGAK